MALRLLSYGEALTAGPGEAGGKAWTLARLAHWGFPVPPGLVVGTGDDRDLRQALAPLVGAASRLGTTELAGAEAAETLSALRAAIVAAPLSACRVAQLEAHLRRLDLHDVPVAVRSSATGEDGEQHSFAGIHKSVLNVRGAEEIARAIRRCQASLWTPQAVAYRRRFAIPDADCLCAVLVCRMVATPGSHEPLAAGVAFSADPRDGRRDRIVIEAVAGLGDKLVSGRATPARHVFALDDWTPAVPEETQPSPLPPEAARRLAILVRRLHWACGGGDVPQDVEWAFDGRTISILQARPITALPRPGFASLAGQPVLWSNANLKEVLAEAPTPMTWNVMQMGISRILFDSHRAAGFEVPDGMPLLRRFAGRPYFDISAQQWAFWDALGVPPEEISRALGGTQPVIRVPRANPFAGRDGRRRMAANLRLLRRLRGLSRRLRPRMDDILARAASIRHADLSAVPSAQLAAMGRGWWDELMGFPIQLANSANALWQALARQIAARHLPAAEADALVGQLMAGGGGVTSAEHACGLQALARLRAENSPALDREWRAFLDRFGHRGFGECELANPRWDEDLPALATLLDGLVQASRAGDAIKAARRAGEERLKGLPPLSRRLLRWMAAKAQAGYALREASKSTLVAVLGVLRHVVLEGGRRMAAAGLLERTEDVFDLSSADLLAWLDGDWDGGAVALARDHRSQRLAWLAAGRPADVIMEEAGQGFRPVDVPSRPGAAGLWQGLAASPGRAEGPACRLGHPGEAGQLAPGGILVARATDPGWTPLFLLAGGVVAEAGGYLSHSAIVAREFGIPAVVNVPGNFDAVGDGEFVAVDGNRGFVERLLPEENK